LHARLEFRFHDNGNVCGTVTLNGTNVDFSVSNGASDLETGNNQQRLAATALGRSDDLTFRIPFLRER
jgi:hypothetical protein